MKKRVFRNYSYMECDDLAAYLMEMAQKGWHFKEWRLGLAFDKGEPREDAYVVEIFTRGSEIDTRPEPDTEEFAEYCREAGWELADSRKKFCIFRKKREDAAAIVTEEERLENVMAEEKEKWIRNTIYAGVAAGMCQIQFYGQYFESWIFGNLMLWLIFIITLQFVREIFGGILLWAKNRRYRQMIAEGGTPYYGIGKRKQNWKQAGTLLAAILGGLIFLAAGLADQMYTVVWITGVVLLFCALIYGAIGLFRTERETTWLIHTGMNVAVVILVLVLTFLAVKGYNREPDLSRAGELPLRMEDYRSISDEISNVNVEKSRNLLGSMEKYDVEYEESSISYEIYDSTQEWILDRIWERQKENSKNLRDCSAEWGTTAAAGEFWGFPVYYVRVPGKIFVLREVEILDQEQIACICEKMQIGSGF